MEPRKSPAAVRPLAFVLAVAIVIVLALTLIGLQGRTTGASNRGTTPGSSVSTTGFQGPDAQERNVQFRLHETTHGH